MAAALFVPAVLASFAIGAVTPARRMRTANPRVAIGRSLPHAGSLGEAVEAIAPIDTERAAEGARADTTRTMLVEAAVPATATTPPLPERGQAYIPRAAGATPRRGAGTLDPSRGPPPA